MKESDKEKYIAEEAFIVQHAGEIPEVAYHSSLYYLMEDPEGPGLKIDANDTVSLKHAVVSRYRAIILRDLDPANRDKRIYKGLARCFVNWQRLVKFCIREQVDYADIRAETSERLREFLHREAADVRSGSRSSSINCSVREIGSLAESLGLLPGDMPERLQELCLDEG
jgi:hypothetical protein